MAAMDSVCGVDGCRVSGGGCARCCAPAAVAPPTAEAPISRSIAISSPRSRPSAARLDRRPEADGARIEIARRLLAAPSEEQEPPRRPQRFAAQPRARSVPTRAAAARRRHRLYLAVGSPQLPGRPLRRAPRRACRRRRPSPISSRASRRICAQQPGGRSRLGRDRAGLSAHGRYAEAAEPSRAPCAPGRNPAPPRRLRRGGSCARTASSREPARRATRGCSSSSRESPEPRSGSPSREEQDGDLQGRRRRVRALLDAPRRRPLAGLLESRLEARDGEARRHGARAAGASPAECRGEPRRRSDAAPSAPS